jgi:hypothetical protein
MVDFWVRYVLLKEQQGVPRETTLGLIEQKFGTEFRQQIEAELAGEIPG